MPDFTGKTLLVTGAATGLGRAVATLAAANGARVAVLDINETEGRDTAAAVGGRFWRQDVADHSAWMDVVAEIEGAFGPIHYAHLNAGVMPRVSARAWRGRTSRPSAPNAIVRLSESMWMGSSSACRRSCPG